MEKSILDAYRSSPGPTPHPSVQRSPSAHSARDRIRAQSFDEGERTLRPREAPGAAVVQRETKKKVGVSHEPESGKVAVGAKLSIAPKLPTIPIRGPLKLKPKLQLDVAGELAAAIEGGRIAAGSGAVTGKVVLAGGFEIGIFIGDVQAALCPGLTAELEATWLPTQRQLVVKGMKLGWAVDAKVSLGPVMEGEVTLLKGQIVEIDTVRLFQSGDGTWLMSTHGVKVLSPTLKEHLAEMQRRIAKRGGGKDNNDPFAKKFADNFGRDDGSGGGGGKRRRFQQVSPAWWQEE